MSEIFVTNHNDFTHSDSFNGEEFFFQPEEKVQISEDAAAHMFGFGRSDKTENLVRLGWATKMNDRGQQVNDDGGIKRLAAFVFTRGMVVEVPAEPTQLMDGLNTREVGAAASA